ncbi:MAG: DUF2452 domain-containing protein [Gammaproteobacteria bacterium]|nr:DUF2452 domain-containing protein [Gammaproteobacteria bacterium]
MNTDQPNPQGKGLSPISGFLTTVNQQTLAPAKPIHQITDELFTSMFILHSTFKFKPVIGKSYWLYQSQNSFKLSLIRPDEWKGNSFGNFIGRCELHQDITWSLELSEQASSNQDFLQFIGNKKSELEHRIQQTDRLIDILPGYQQQLPFYQRAFTSALTHSLSVSMYKSGIALVNQETAQLANIKVT